MCRVLISETEAITIIRTVLLLLHSASPQNQHEQVLSLKGAQSIRKRFRDISSLGSSVLLYRCPKLSVSLSLSICIYTYILTFSLALRKLHIFQPLTGFEWTSDKSMVLLYHQRISKTRALRILWPLLRNIDGSSFYILSTSLGTAQAPTSLNPKGWHVSFNLLLCLTLHT